MTDDEEGVCSVSDTTSEKVPLSAVRDLLLPAVAHVRAFHPDVELEINIKPQTDNLLVVGRHRKLDRELGFVITRNLINDRTYLETFKPSLDRLIECLELPPEQYNFALYGPKG